MALNVKKSLMKAQALTRKGEVGAAMAQYQAILDSYPQNRAAREGLAQLEAAPKRAKRLPERREVEHMLGLLHAGQLQHSLDLARKAARAFPDQPLFHNIAGTALSGLGQPEAAIDALRQAITLQPDYAEAYQNLGGVYSSLARHREAIDAFRQALHYGADPRETSGNLLYELAKTCDWQAMEQVRAALPPGTVAGLGGNPFKMLAIEDSAPQQLDRARAHARALCTSRAADIPVRTAGERVRVGYFSPDFRGHAVSYLMARVFELHDRSDFEIHAFSLIPVDEDDPMRQRIGRAVDQFHDVASLKDEQVASLAREHEIDIAVDLAGYTKGARPAIFAHRAAPIQINYLGYPGTMGAPFMDYLMADPVVITPAQREHYSECILYLPHCYQANDDTRDTGASEVSREQEGLPVDGFVFCCFNNNYKIGPEEFAIWMRLLHAVEDSVLWLMQSHVLSRDALRNQAQSHGIDPQRLVFAQPRPLQQHLERQQLADLFLDTFIYNAHTTASDALRAGLPVLTVPGESFASRVAASLVQAVGMPELVCASPADYEARALALATDRASLAALRGKLLKERATAPLFDSARSTADIESAYHLAVQRLRNGLAPADLRLSGDEGPTRPT